MTTTHVDTAAALRAFPALEDLTDHECAALAAFMRPERCARGGVLFDAAAARTSLHFVTSGRVKVGVASPGGRTVAVEFLDAPVVVGEYATGGEGTGVTRVTAVSDVESLVLDAADVVAAARLHPGVALSVIASFSDRLSGLASRIEGLTLHDASQRVIRVILNVATAAYESRGVPVVEGVTHQELAMLAGTSRETATRTISTLVKRGIVATKGRRLVVDLIRLHETVLGG